MARNILIYVVVPLISGTAGWYTGWYLAKWLDRRGQLDIVRRWLGR